MAFGFQAKINGRTVESADTGKELIGFIPGKVFGKLSNLTSIQYGHEYYVDGAPTTGDVYYDSAWHSVLVGGLNKGGQEIYALDVAVPGKGTRSALFSPGHGH